jgi:pyruvyltransferase
LQKKRESFKNATFSEAFMNRILAIFFLLPWFSCFADPGLPLYYYREVNLQNFGDYLSLKLVERIVNGPVRVCTRHTKEKKLLAIGSIIWVARDNDVVWGTGIHPKHPLNDYHFKKLDIRAVRGPLTKQFLKEKFDIDCPEVYGDPALLVPYFFPEFKRKENPKYEYLILPHYSEKHIFPKEIYPNVAYTTDPWDEIMDKIVDSKFVISSTLHGIVVAESFGIPARMLRITEKEPLFKYQDYYLGTGRPNFRFATSIQEALALGGEKPFQCDLKKLIDCFPYDQWQVDANAAIPKSLSDEYDYLPEPEVIDEIKEPPYEGNDIDLEQNLDEFVLETKKIDIPGFPNAFNPSIVKWRGSYLLSFRIYDHGSTNGIGLVFLDKDFNLASEPKVLNFLQEDPSSRKKRQDPRLICIGDDLLIAYNNILNYIGNREIRRMLIAKVTYDGNEFFAERLEHLTEYEGKNDLRPEKNWAPFDYHGELLIAYSQQPHKIFRPIWGTGACETVGNTKGDIKWDWGALRGGTPALLIDGEYLAFFHSSKNIASIHSKGKVMQHYVMGAYTYSAEPPFAITKISKHPIVGKNFYYGAEYKTWKPVRVVFPGGFVHENNYFWVAYGRQDHEIWVAKLDKKMLLNSLEPVTTIP